MKKDEMLVRKAAQISLVKEFGGDFASFKKVAQEALRRGMYSSKTSMSDIEYGLQRIWRKGKRGLRSHIAPPSR